MRGIVIWVVSVLLFNKSLNIIDQNGVFPAEVKVSELNGINDDVMNFPFETQVQIFDLPSMESIDQSRALLWQFHGPGSGNTLSNYNQLYQFYGH